MDPKHTVEIAKHLEKQNQLLTTAYKSMSDELHELQVEEEMLMRKFYELMSAQGLRKKDEGNNGSGPDDGNNTQSDSLIFSDNREP